MRLALFVKQAAEGCDYTIGCGQKLIELSTDDITKHDELEEEIRQIVEDYGGADGENRFATMSIVEILQDLDVDQFDEEEVEDSDKAARRREYERLKREFG